MLIGINGLGRVGRGLIRALHGNDAIEVAAINDKSSIDIITSLLRHDTLYGTFPDSISEDGDSIKIGGKRIRCFHSEEPGGARWGDYGVKWVIEATGQFKDRRSLNAHIDSGADGVILTAVSLECDKMIVYGLNEADLADSDRILSAASCTTHSIAPVLKVIKDSFEVKSLFYNTVHCYNPGQVLLDNPASGARRMRAAGLSMIPTTSSSLLALAGLFPDLKGKIEGMAVRVPVINVSLTDLVVSLSDEVKREEIIKLIENASKGKLKGIIGITDEELVSWDYMHCPFSAVLDSPLSRAIGNQIRLVLWYDNEWGYIQRLVDFLQYLLRRD